MDFGADADKELAGVWFVWPLTKCFTGGQVAVNSFLKRVFQFADRFSMEADNISYAYDVANKKVLQLEVNPEFPPPLNLRFMIIQNTGQLMMPEISAGFTALRWHIFVL